MNPIRAAALAALVFVPVASRAQQSPPEVVGVLAVSEPPGPTPELADLTRAFRGAVAEKFKGVLSQEDLRLRMLGQTGASLTELDRAYAGAVAAYQAGDYEAAVRTLRAVAEDLERLPESEDAFRQWSRAVLRLARAEGSLGRKGESKDTMERLLRADPAAKADPELYPPSFVRQLEEVRQALRAQPKRKVVVTAGGRTARVFVEGRDVGPAPATLSLPAGRYRVSGLVGEVRASAGTVEVGDADQTVALDFALAESFRPAAGPGIAVSAPQRAKGIVAAGATLKLDRVLAARFAKDGDVLYLVGSSYDVRRGALQREGLLRLSGFTPPKDGLAGLATFLATGERPPQVELAREPKKEPVAADLKLRAPEPPGTGEKRLLRWSPVATGVLAVGLAGFSVYEAMKASGKYHDANAMLNPDGTLKIGMSPDVYNRYVSDGDSAKRAAWIGGGGAAVALAATGLLGYLSYKQTGEIGPFRF